MSMEGRPNLIALADRAGILRGYHDIEGKYCPLQEEAAVALLAGMGLDGSGEDVAGETLKQLERQRQASLLDPVRVVRVGQPAGEVLRWAIPWEHPELIGRDTFGWRLTLHGERGGVATTAEGRVRRSDGDSDLAPSWPVLPEPGYHTLQLELDAGKKLFRAEQLLIVAPRRCFRPEDAWGQSRSYGLLVNFYSLRDERDWGIGDLSTLRAVGEAVACHGAAFIGTNPLHALSNLGHDYCPYSPMSRLFQNDIYLDIECVPEFGETPEARAMAASPDGRERIAELRGKAYIDYEGVARFKRGVMRRLFETFRRDHLGKRTSRGSAFERFCREGGRPLQDFATFQALAEWLEESGKATFGFNCRNWPAAYRDPQSKEVVRFRHEHADAVDFWAFVQFEIERQLKEVSTALHRSGMRIGLYHDLAVGSSGGGADAWMFPGLFAQEMELGAPPDPYSAAGQTWGFPPLVPHRLRAERHAYWISLIRACLRHAGMLRIDHAIGLYRQYWVPRGRPGTEGGFVRYPTEELLGILALESQRSRTIIVGEDLGLVPPEVPAALAEWGAFSMRLVHFEREHDGSYRPPQQYPTNALVCVSTHDHPPLAAIWSGSDLDLRRRIGSIGDDEELNRQRAERARSREALVRLLIAQGLLTENEQPSFEAVRRAIHELLVRSPSPLLGISLDDLAGEEEPVNLPGVPPEKFASWSRRMSQTVEKLLKDDAIASILDNVASAIAVGGNDAEN